MLFTLLILSMFLTLTIGAVKIPLYITVKILLNQLPYINLDQIWTDSQETIILVLRLPRIILAIVVGGMLSIAGVGFQGILRNPLADPYILGISAGATLGASFCIMFFDKISLQNSFPQKLSIPIFAFLGSLLSLLLVLTLAKNNKGRDRLTILLAGIVVQSLLGALLSFIIAVSGQQMQTIIFWMMGSLANCQWQSIFILLPYLVLGYTFLYIQHRNLNVISLGEQAALHLGMEVEKTKISILFVASLLTASAVSIVGIIGFVGLVVPHIVRLLVGPNHRVLLPVCLIAGSLFLLWSDTLARTLIASREIPIGVITAFTGAPFFGYLLKKKA